MKLFVIGASGRTGKEIVQQALEKGHRVTALVRSSKNVSEKNERLTILEGSPLDEAQLTNAIKGHDAVISVLGPNEPSKPSTLMHDSALATTRAMHKAGVKRLVALSASAHFPGFINAIGRFFLREHMRDSLEMEKIVQESGLDWTIARPPRLTQGNYFGYRSQVDAPPTLGFTLSRKGLASFMLNVIEQEQHVGKIVGLARTSRLFPGKTSTKRVESNRKGSPIIANR